MMSITPKVKQLQMFASVQCPQLHRCAPAITTSALYLTLDSDNYQDTKTLLIFPVCALSYFVNTSRVGTSNVYFIGGTFLWKY